MKKKETEGKGILIFAQGLFKVENINLNHAKILKEIKKLEYENVQSTDNLPTTQKGNFSQISKSIRILNLLPSGKDLEKEITFHIQVAIDQFFGYDIKNKIINTWVTKSNPGAITGGHTHSNFWLSAVYYPHGSKKEKFSIWFEKNEYQSFSPNITDNNVLNSNVYMLPVQEGDLVIFPSNLKHKIGPNNSKKTRYSIAFNILPSGKIGKRDTFLEYTIN